jgi:hypothetical protein
MCCSLVIGQEMKQVASNIGMLLHKGKHPTAFPKNSSAATTAAAAKMTAGDVTTVAVKAMNDEVEDTTTEAITEAPKA